LEKTAQSEPRRLRGVGPKKLDGGDPKATSPG